MKKGEIISFFAQLPQAVIETISNALSDDTNYEIEQIGSCIKIHTPITEGDFGSYYELSYEYDAATKNSIVITTKKSYNPMNELRYGFMQTVGLEMFTTLDSTVFSPEGQTLYSVWFSDDNKYYGYREMPLDYSKESLKRYFSETTPVFEKGRIINHAKSSYQPFTNVWERYGNSHVIKVHGRNPMKGEYSYIGITFDDKSHEDVRLLSESYGQIYVRGREMKLNNERDIVGKIEELYQEANTPAGFDDDGFQVAFDTEMFKAKEY